METWGTLSLEPGGWRISIRDGTPYRRARFTVAHEIGHIILYEQLADEPEALRALQDAEHWHAVERTCNLLAAEMLMPREDFQSSALTCSLHPVGLRTLYDHYLVSWEPLLLRITEVFGGSLVPFARFRRHAGERLALRVKRSPAGRGVWMPAGLTSRYLHPDVVEQAYVHGAAGAEAVYIDLRGHAAPRPAAMAISLSAARDAHRRRPASLEGFRAPEEPRTPFDVALLLNSAPTAAWRGLLANTEQHGDVHLRVGT